MATQRKSNAAGGKANSSSLSGSYHNKTVADLPRTSDPEKILAITHPELVESVVLLYDSSYSDAQYEEAFKHYSPDVEFMDPGLHLFNRLDMKAQFTYLRLYFTEFHPFECHIATTVDRIYIDAKMDWKLFGGRVSLKVHHILRARVEDGLIVWMEDAWSVNDRVGALLGAVGLYEPIRWLISQPSSKWMRYQLGY